MNSSYNRFSESLSWKIKQVADNQGMPCLQDWLLSLYKKLVSEEVEDNISENNDSVVTNVNLNKTYIGGNLQSNITTIISHYHEKKELLDLEELNFILEVVSKQSKHNISHNSLELAREYKQLGHFNHAICCYVMAMLIDKTLSKELPEVIECCNESKQLLKNDLLLNRFVRLNNVTVVAFLLDHKVALKIDVNFSDDINKKTALHIACEEGYVEMFELLLSKGADITNNSHKESCLHLACRSGKETIVDKLIKHPEIRKIINAKCKADYTHDTALHVAVKCSQFSIAQKLIKAEADLTSKNTLGQSVLFALILNHSCKDIKAQDDFACYLMEIYPNFTQDFNEFLLEEAIKQGLYKFFINYLQQLVKNENGMNLIKILYSKIFGKLSLDKDEQEKYNKLEAYKKILEYILLKANELNIDICELFNNLDRCSYNILCLLIKEGEVNIVKCLLQQYPKETEKNWLDNTILYSAAENKKDDTAIVELFINKKPSFIDSYAEDGLTALHKSVSCGNYQITRFLLEQKASVNIKTKKTTQDTSLTLIADICQRPMSNEKFKRYYKTCEVLMEYSADINIKNDSGETALSIQENAPGGGKGELIKLFSCSTKLNVFADKHDSTTLYESKQNIQIKNSLPQYKEEGADYIKRDSELGAASVPEIIYEPLLHTNNLSEKLEAIDNHDHTVYDNQLDIENKKPEYCPYFNRKNILVASFTGVVMIGIGGLAYFGYLPKIWRK